MRQRILDEASKVQGERPQVEGPDLELEDAWYEIGGAWMLSYFIAPGENLMVRVPVRDGLVSQASSVRVKFTGEQAQVWPVVRGLEK